MAQFPLSELTTTLLREVFQAITDSADEQNASFADLASQVGMPLAAYQEKLLGADDEERRLTAEGYVREVVLPLLALPSAAALPEQIAMDGESRKRLIDFFRGITVGSESIGQRLRPATADGFWSLDLESLRLFVLEKLVREAKLAYQKIKALLGAGVSRINVVAGSLETKVTLHVAAPPPQPVPKVLPPFFEMARARARFPAAEQPLSRARSEAVQPLRLQARLANESSPGLAQSTELAGSVRIDFRVDSFPSLNPSAP